MRALRLFPLSRCIRRGLTNNVSAATYEQWEADYSPRKARDFFSSFESLTGEVIISKDEGSGVAQMVFDNATGKNALTGRMFVQVADAVEELRQWSRGRLLILQGAKGSFCSGGDLKFVKEVANPKDGYVMCRFVGDTLREMRRLSMISVARVEGYALGGGAELALACDFRALHQKSKIGYVQARIGVSPGWGTAARLCEVVGRERGLQMLATGSVLSAADAMRVGLADALFTNDSDFDAYIEQFLKSSVDVTRAAKQLAVGFADIEEERRKASAERAVFVQMWGGPEHLDALQAGRKHK